MDWDRLREIEGRTAFAAQASSDSRSVGAEFQVMPVQFSFDLIGVRRADPSDEEEPLMAEVGQLAYRLDPR